ncbi:MAG TPA: DUF2125 domain-containing protein [Xanthobacteraceae bacterium]|nr:DUF2125 domain-containing protein [Xanthobacteraceae bacterium]
MQGESPLNMMRPRQQRAGRPAPAPAPRRRLGPIVAAIGVVIALAAGWSWLWYHAAAVADRTLSGWVEREAAAGRVYSCGYQGIGGFPLRIEVTCVTAGAAINSNQPPFAVSAKDITFTAAIYHPTLLVAEVTGPLTISLPGQSPIFIANWSRAQMSVGGLPPQPDSVAVSFDQPRLDHTASADETVFTADHAEVVSRIVDGSPGDNPVIDTQVEFKAATAPTLHPLLAAPLQGDIDVELRGFKDLAPKPWAARFREMQAAGGAIEIKHLRIERTDAIVVGAGTLTINADGKLDGLIRVAIAGVETIVPQLGVDQLIGRGIDRLTGAPNQTPDQGLGTLDRLLPGLSGVVRQSANASLIDSLNKMGEPTEIDKKPAIVLPLRISDGAVYLGLIPLGEVPPLF